VFSLLRSPPPREGRPLKLGTATKHGAQALFMMDSLFSDYVTSVLVRGGSSPDHVKRALDGYANELLNVDPKLVLTARSALYERVTASWPDRETFFQKVYAPRAAASEQEESEWQRLPTEAQATYGRQGQAMNELSFVFDYRPDDAVIVHCFRCEQLTSDELARLAHAWDRANAGSRQHDRTRAEARKAAWDGVRSTMEAMARTMTSKAALDAGYKQLKEKVLIAACDAALALTVYDLIDAKAFTALARPWRDAELPLPNPTPIR
jgi:hypothetical protein